MMLPARTLRLYVTAVAPRATPCSKNEKIIKTEAITESYECERELSLVKTYFGRPRPRFNYHSNGNDITSSPTGRFMCLSRGWVSTTPKLAGHGQMRLTPAYAFLFLFGFLLSRGRSQFPMWRTDVANPLPTNTPLLWSFLFASMHEGRRKCTP